MKKIVWLIAGLCTAVSLMSCETIKGIGRDIENTGSSVQRSLSK